MLKTRIGSKFLAVYAKAEVVHTLVDNTRSPISGSRAFAKHYFSFVATAAIGLTNRLPGQAARLAAV